MTLSNSQEILKHQSLYNLKVKSSCNFKIYDLLALIQAQKRFTQQRRIQTQLPQTTQPQCCLLETSNTVRTAPFCLPLLITNVFKDKNPTFLLLHLSSFSIMVALNSDTTICLSHNTTSFLTSIYKFSSMKKSGWSDFLQYLLTSINIYTCNALCLK